MKLISHTVKGNIQAAVRWINDENLAGFVVTITHYADNYTIVILRVEDDFTLSDWMAGLYGRKK